MPFKPGDHICELYSTRAELVDAVVPFLTDGLRSGEPCWYVGSPEQTEAVGAGLKARRVDVAAETARDALHLISGERAYIVHGDFNPETTIRVFNDAIEQAYTDGFSGFRAAADMTWALDCKDGTEKLIVYEALLRSLFATCRVIGLCLYDRTRMPLDVIDGALAAHPVVGSHGRYEPNPAFDPRLLDRLA